MHAAFLPVILAAAGGGSSSFSGGGGGGGGGSSFSGGGSSYGGGTNGSISFGGILVIAVIIGLVLLVGYIKNVLGARAYVKKRRARAKKVQMASFEAAEDDAWFAAESVTKEADTLFRSVQASWDARDRKKLAAMVSPDLMVEWTRRLDDFDNKGWHNRVEIVRGPSIEYVGLVNREDDAEDRVVVRVEATLKDYCQTKSGNVILHEGATSEQTTLSEYWTLARTGEQWTIASIQQQAEGDHELDAEVVASPWSDTKRLQDEALVEGAVADKIPEGFSTADLANFEFAGTAREEALDLALSDGRFAPDLLEIAARRAVAGWVEAIDGADDALLKVASPDAAHELLHPGDPSETTRLVVRGGTVEAVRIEALDAKASPATMTIAIDVRGRRYIEDRDTIAVVSGSRSDEITFTERWTLALAGDDTSPWTIVATA